MEKQNRRQNNKIETKVMKNQGRKENLLFFFFFLVIFPPTVLARVLYITYNTISNFVTCLKKKNFSFGFDSKVKCRTELKLSEWSTFRLRLPFVLL